MKWLTDLFAAGYRLAASLNKTADLTDRFNHDFESRLAPPDQPPRLTSSADVDRGADTVTSTRVNGKVKVKG